MATTQLERLRSSRSLLLKASTRSRFQRAARDGLKKALRIRPNALFAHACCITEMTYSESSRSPEHRATPQRRSSPWKQPHRWRRAGRACTVALSWSLSPLHFGWCGSGTPFAFEFAVATQWRPCGGGGVEGASHVGAAARAKRLLRNLSVDAQILSIADARLCQVFAAGRRGGGAGGSATSRLRRRGSLDHALYRLHPPQRMREGGVGS